MKMGKINKILKLLSLATILCLTLGSCHKKLTSEERRKNLETMVSEEDCKQITANALQKVLKDLGGINYEKVIKGVQEDIYKLDKEKKLYIQVVVRGNVRGKLNGIDSIYYFYFYGRIPENLADKKEFDGNGYNLSLKNGKGYFIYSNKEDTDSLNLIVAEGIRQDEALKEAKETVLNIDGIKLCFVKKNDLGGVTGLFYDSDKELSSNQMKKVVKQIVIEFDFVEFSLKGKSYAYYDREGDYVSYDLR